MKRVDEYKKKIKIKTALFRKSLPSILVGTLVKKKKSLFRLGQV